MNTIRKLLLFALPFLLLTSCDKEEMADDAPGAQGEITFAIDFAPQTRVATGADFTSTWEDGDRIGLFAVAHNGTGGTLATNGNYITNVALTYNRAGGTWTPSEPLWWPGSDKVLSFYAYHPYLPAVGFDPTALAFSVVTDQNTITSGKSHYNFCDLVTARSDNAGAGWGKGSTVPLTFNHALAMVQVSVPPDGKGFGPSESLNVTLRGVKTKCIINLANISATPGSEVTLSATDNDATAITMYRVEQPADANYETSYTYRALVPAQSVAAGSSLFWFEHEGRQLLTDGGQAQTLVMKGGQAETFTRTLPATLVHTVPIPAGGKTFAMGETGWAVPVHDVTLTKDFRMSKYQVTNAQYATFLNANSIGSNGQGSVTYHYDNFTTTVTENRPLISTYSWGVTHNGSAWKAQTGFENHPVINVTWLGAKAYADWAGGCLPTEAQWEYACRGETTTAFYFGDDDSDLVNYGWSMENSPDGTKAVGQKTPNAYGLYDMHGNVWEWCSDWYTVYGNGPDTDPVASATGYARVLRGGSWTYFAQSCRSAYRSLGLPDLGSNRLGFRVVFNKE